MNSRALALGKTDAPCAICNFVSEFVCVACGGPLCPRCCDHGRCTHVGPGWSYRVRQLLIKALDVEDKAVVEAAAMLAAGHGVRFVFTIQNGLHVDVKAERIDYDVKGRVR